MGQSGFRARKHLFAKAVGQPLRLRAERLNSLRENGRGRADAFEPIRQRRRDGRIRP